MTESEKLLKAAKAYMIIKGYNKLSRVSAELNVYGNFFYDVESGKAGFTYKTYRRMIDYFEEQGILIKD